MGKQTILLNYYQYIAGQLYQLHQFLFLLIFKQLASSIAIAIHQNFPILIHHNQLTFPHHFKPYACDICSQRVMCSYKLPNNQLSTDKCATLQLSFMLTIQLTNIYRQLKIVQLAMQLYSYRANHAQSVMTCQI